MNTSPLAKDGRDVRKLLALRWNPGADTIAVILSCAIVTLSLYTATFVVTPERGGGLLYFFVYAIVTATLFGVGIPLGWQVIHRRRPVASLGITGKNLGLSLGIQLVLSILLYFATLSRVELPPLSRLAPLVGLALAIGFFEALFWRGWVFARLEEAFGLIPALLFGSLLYAAYHVGYGMPLAEMAFLFLIGLMFAAVFRLTRSVFILWPVFQPMGQLVTLIEDGLKLPVLATLGFAEVLVVMLVLVWLANRTYRKRQAASGKLVEVAA